jgi:hypothetical protein
MKKIKKVNNWRMVYFTEQIDAKSIKYFYSELTENL